MSMMNPFDSTRRNPWEAAKRFRETDPIASKRIGQREDEPQKEERLTPESMPDDFQGESPALASVGMVGQRQQIEQLGSRATNLESQLASATAAQRAREAARSHSGGGKKRTGTRLVDAEGNVVKEVSAGARVFAGSREQYEAQKAAMGGRAPTVVGTTRGPNGQQMPVTATNTSSAARQAVLRTAQGFVGSPYRLGGKTVDGVDCSGLVMVAYQNAGIPVSKHSASWQRDNIPGTRTSISNLEPGDLVAWKDGSHIAIYAGGGMIIDASSSGGGRYRKLWAPESAVIGVRVNFPGDY
jgi:cell wall-associated NlpC family hydrolase